MFSKLRKVYFFLVHYLPGPIPQASRAPNSVSSPTGVQHPATGYTALHAILKYGLQLETVQVTGNPALTDSCMETILAQNPLAELRRLVISNPSSQEQMMVVPLTLRSVVLLHASCPKLQCLGDLRHWAVTPNQRGNITRQGTPLCIQQSVWTRVRISAAGRGLKSSSVCRQTAVH
eukprot:TRINITY_DN17937_c0_g1_i1.p1 TRINITY_DN17937_c0_g1~~TRINITY_DN17937_c0_g1_i1.p1  ORF type:complete len:176 (-),score=22.78 TRINITY_DN17937_c0_g1_i1:133-660(-)